MKILHINDKVNNAGGVETYLHQLIEYSPKVSGVEMSLIGVSNIGDDYTFDFYSQPSKKHSTNNWKAYLSEVVENYDVLHVHSISNPELISHLFSLEKPVFRSMHEPRIVCPGQGKFLRKSEAICTQNFGLACFYKAYKEGCCNRHPRRLLRAYQNVRFETTFGKRHYKGVFVMSDYMKKEALKVGFSDKQLIFNPYFTPEVKQASLKNSREDSLKSILFIGRLSQTKGVHFFIEVALDLLKKQDDLVFDIVGDGHDAARFKAMVPNNLKDKIRFYGWQSRQGIDQFIQKAYILLFPSIYPEAFGISGIEAMMHGKPVVGFDVGGVSTWLKDQKTGFLVKAKDTFGMIEKVSLLLDNHSLYTSFSENAYRVAQKEFVIKKHMDVLLESYKVS